MHENYFKRCLDCLPSAYSSTDTNRMTLIYFILSSLDVLNKLENNVDDNRKKQIIDWVYEQQIIEVEGKEDSIKYCGFRGSNYTGIELKEKQTKLIPYNQANLAMTYTALTILIILKDDFARVDKKSIINSLKYLQQEDGSFVPVYGSKESDLRFTYCAFVVSYLLNDFTGFDVELALNYIKNSQTYDFAISQGPNLESHGGSTYCGLAALHLINKMDSIINDKENLIKWCLNRQNNGFHGRLNKPDDTCYSFWIGASLNMLKADFLINKKLNQNFLFSTQTKVGGFSKYPGGFPDLLHSYMGLTGLSLNEFEGLKKIHPSINLSLDAVEHWKNNILPNL
ncbi:geranylgeranyl transferase type-1 subunit beta-like protein [Neoconidiobolus thromboides FSU 785]|nr:geranylgeranyl transferase type-1 subunit beta-like protein [Neoconidiobolus thromboides FSU 785]